MSALPPELANLPREEKLDLVQRLLASIADVDAELTPSQWRELEERIAADIRNPEEGEPWEQVKAELLDDSSCER